MRPTRRPNQRGNAMVEFAISFPIIALMLGGIFQFGYTFYIYNGLQSAVRAGSRYASVADYDSPSGTTFKTAVKNVVVYGKTNPSGGDKAQVPGLTTSQVTVTDSNKDSTGIPIDITVQISNYTVNAVWKSYTFTNKPKSTFQYLGQFK